jgi:hypothetical protein
MPATPPAPTAPVDPAIAEQMQAAAVQFQHQVMVHGFQVGFGWAAGFLALAAVIVAVFIRAGKDAVSSDKASVHFG